MTPRPIASVVRRIVAALCIVVGSVTLIDMYLKLRMGLVYLNLFAVLLIVGFALLPRNPRRQLNAAPDAEPPPGGRDESGERSARPVWKWLRMAGLAAGVGALALTCLFPAWVKMTREFEPAPAYFGVRRDPLRVTYESAGYHYYLWEHPREDPDTFEEAVNPRVLYDYDLNRLEQEWMLVASLTAVWWIVLSSPGRRPGNDASGPERSPGPEEGERSSCSPLPPG
jgi:hypothetical protein